MSDPRDLDCKILAFMAAMDRILEDPRLTDHGKVESLKELRDSACSVPKPVSTAAAAGGGGGSSSEPQPTPKSTLFSYAGTVATGAHPHPTPTRRPDQPPAPKQKAKKEVVVDENGIPTFWTKKVTAILTKPTEELTKEDIKCIWEFLRNVFPHRCFPDNIFTKLVYGEHPYLHKGKPMPLHNYLQELHPVSAIRDFFNRVYDEDGNCLLFTVGDKDE
jgi:hypothetical protein